MKFHLQVQERQVLVAQDYERNVAQEIAVLRRCGAAEHPGLVQLIGTFETESAIYMVLELGAGGDLHGVLARRGSLDEGAAAFYTAEIVSGLAALHAQAVVWGDLKPENVLLTGSGHVKLTDFGSATIVVNGGSGGPPPAGDQGASKVEGTAEYIAPEVAAGQPPSFESDARRAYTGATSSARRRRPLRAATRSSPAQQRAWGGGGGGGRGAVCDSARGTAPIGCGELRRRGECGQ
jgi:3-phosphoinositide dependent protein kinase-1